MSTPVTAPTEARRLGHRARIRPGWQRNRFGLTRGLLLLLLVLTGLLAGVVPAYAAPDPSPTPSSPVADAACATKAPGSVAWCMPWAVHVDTPAPEGRSHWVTQCSKAISAADKKSCAAASIILDPTPPDGTASVLMDGPSTGSGPSGLINCAALWPAGYNPNSHQQPLWDSKYATCQQQVKVWSAQMYDPNPKRPDCAETDVSCKVQRRAQDALSAGISSGIQGLVDVVVQGTIFLLSKLAIWVFKETTISSPDQAFYDTYNSLAGVLVVLIFVFFIVSTIINGLRTTAGPGPLATLGGLVRAVLGITFAGGIAFTIVAAWDQATNAVIEANARAPYDPSRLVTGFTELTAGAGTLFIALLLSLLATIGLLLLFVIMLFRGLLATGAALFGAMAMTGQVMPETRHWGRRWFWTVNALGSSKFFIAQLWIYGSRSAYESDSVMNALRAVLLIWLMVVAPWILLRLTTMWDGYLSDVNAHGILSATGGPLQIGADLADGFRTGAADAGGPGSSPASGAAGVMDENTAGMPTIPGGEAAGIGDGEGRQAADAAATGGDGGKVGESADDPGAAQQGQNGAGDDPNAQEADGIGAGATSAEHDISSGQLTAPGDTTGDHGSLPLTPAGAQTADPTGGAMTDLVGSPAGDAGGAAASPGDAAAAIPGDAGDPGDTSTPSEPAGQGSPRGGAAGSGGSDGAAAAAADVPIVPL
ncbi:hypothetical protein [Actinoplanes sp. NPDC049118]|uniref:hypothetical protein n=1 Tax=Actinoplanes sp. NPDC049118 TaxID=3155769 RepID=UPI0033FF26CC